MSVMRRLILFLQQSSVEWASSLWMHVVQELDPEFKRTARALPFYLSMPITDNDCDRNLGSCTSTDCWQACERSDALGKFSIMARW